MAPPTPDRDSTNAELAAKAAELEQELAKVKAELEEERARRIAAEQVVLPMKRDLERLERQLTGSKSERHLDPNRQSLPDPPAGSTDDDAESDRDSPGDGEDGQDTEPTKRKRSRKGGRWKIADLAELRTDEHRSLASDQCWPCGCGAQGRSIGVKVSWRLEYEAAKLYRIKIIREKGTFPDRVGPGQATMVAAEPSTLSFALRAPCAATPCSRRSRSTSTRTSCRSSGRNSASSGSGAASRGRPCARSRWPASD